MTEPVIKNGEEQEPGSKIFADDAAKAAEAKAAEEKAASEKAAADKSKADGEAKAKADAEAKAKEESGKKKIVPEKYELKTPEGSKLSAQDVEEIASYAKERGFSQEEAQAQLDRESKLKENFEKQSLAQLESATKEWLETAKSDKEIGGEAFPKHAELAKRVVTRFGTPEFKAELERTGLGNHPELVRVFVRIGKAMTDDQFIMPGSQTVETKDVAKKFYGDSEKKE